MNTLDINRTVTEMEREVADIMDRTQRRYTPICGAMPWRHETPPDGYKIASAVTVDDGFVAESRFPFPGASITPQSSPFLEMAQGRREPLLDPDALEQHMNYVETLYDRPRDLQRLKLPAWVIAPPLPRDQLASLEQCAREQLRTALIIFALRRSLGDVKQSPDGYIRTRALTRAEERIRIRQLSYEAELKMEGALS